MLALLMSPSTAQDLDVIKFLEGDWSSEEVAYTPNGEVKFTLKGKNVRVLEGKWLQIDETLSLPGNRTSENKILVSKAPDGEIRMYWFTAGPPEPMAFRGKPQGRTLQLTEAKGATRITYRFGEEGKYEATVETKSGETWRKAVDAKYSKL